MPAKARLDDIVDALDSQFDESSSFLDSDTGQVETVSADLLVEAEESDEAGEPDLPAWQKEEWEIAKRIVTTGQFLKLPTKYDVHEWAIMQDFAQSLEPDRVRGDLLNALHRKGAFRNFKDALHRHRIESDWFAFRADALRKIAIDWCEKHQVAWE